MKNLSVIEEEYGRCLRTYTGKKVDVFDPDPESICIEDIAHALSNLCRFAGHVKYFYSVAEHSLITAMLAPPELRKQALLHDATEAYMIDLPRPIKREIKQYCDIEDNLAAVIAKKFGIEYPLHKQIDKIDKAVCQSEFRHLLLGEKIWNIPAIRNWTPEIMEAIFLMAYRNNERGIELMHGFNA